MTTKFSRLPVDSRWPITGRFGDTYSLAGRTWTHLGVDFGCPVGTPVYAPAMGEVVPFANDGSFGVGICLRHNDGWHTLYAHLSSVDVQVGDVVLTGELIGWSGATGYITGPHLHWQFCATSSFPRDVAQNRDPMAYYDPNHVDSEEQQMSSKIAQLERIVIMLGEVMVGDPTGRQFTGLDELERTLTQHRYNQTRFIPGLANTQRELIRHKHAPDGSVIWSGKF